MTFTATIFCFYAFIITLECIFSNNNNILFVGGIEDKFISSACFMLVFVPRFWFPVRDADVLHPQQSYGRCCGRTCAVMLCLYFLN